MKVTRLLALGLFIALTISVPISHAGLLGPANDYNAFVFGDMTVWNSDSQGRIAVGGNVDVQFYGVGSLAAPDTYSIVSGGNVDYVSGSVQNGGIFAGGDVVLDHHTVNGDVTANGTISYGSGGGTVTGTATPAAGATSPIDFISAYNTLSSTSNALKNMTANGTTYDPSWHAIKFTGTESVNIFDLDGSSLDNAVSMTFDVAADSISIVNVSGTVNDFSGFGINLGGNGKVENILYNFYESTDLTIGNISIQGSILAANAAIDFNSANIDGTLIAGSITGKGQFHQHLFNPNVPIVPEPVSTILFITGGATLGFMRFRKKRSN